jgi:anti-sigma B factor antagonist
MGADARLHRGVAAGCSAWQPAMRIIVGVQPAISISDDNGVSVIELRGEHDLATATEVRDVLKRAVAEGRPSVVELTLTDFIDSSILGVLLAGLRHARDANLGFVFVVQADDTGAVQKTLAGSGLLAFFPVRGSLEAATAAAREGINQPGPAA